MNADMKKRGLGRGLDALFRDARSEEQAFAPKIKRADEMVAAAAAVSAAVAATSAPAPVAPANNQPQRKLSIDKLTPGKYQPRRVFNDEAIDQLAESIAVHGILQPLLVRPLSATPNASTMYEIIAGERRWRAAQKAQLHELPVVIQDLTDKEALEISLIENLQREDLNAVEEAEGYQRLMDEFGHTQDVLARQLGKSRSHVTNTLRLLKLPPFVRDMVQSGELSAGHARALIGAKNAEDIAKSIIAEGLSVRQTEKLVQETDAGKAARKHTPKPTAGFKQKDVDILALEQKMTNLLGLKVIIDGEGAQGRLIVEYKSLDQLDDVLARLSLTP